MLKTEVKNLVARPFTDTVNDQGEEGKWVVSTDRPYISYISAEFLPFFKGPQPFKQQKTFFDSTRLHRVV